MAPGHEERRVLTEVLVDFAEDAHNGQMAALMGAAKRAIGSEKARPLREIVKGIDAANGGLLGRAFQALKKEFGR